MRIVRFLDNDGRVLCGADQGDGTATRLLDPLSVLGRGSAANRRELFRGRRALVADDDENMRELMATVLSSVGCQCTVCGDGAEAIDALDANGLDLVVSDIMMPHHNGYEVYAAAKSRRADMPVVLVTGFGYDPNHSLIRASEEGLTTVLYKPFTPQQLLDEIARAIRGATSDPADILVATGEPVRIGKRLAPLEPIDVICIGRNYPSRSSGPEGSSRSFPRDDARPESESDEDLEVFMKPSGCVQAIADPIRLPEIPAGWGDLDPRVAAEGELAVVIGTRARNIPVDEALQHVLGYTIANDVTARHWQQGDSRPRWMRGKGFDTFCPLGPVLVTAADMPDPNDLEIRTFINGELARRGSTREMIRSVESVVSTLSQHITLEPGAVILTGAPPAVDADAESRSLEPGDEVAVEIDGIGRLVNPVEAPVAVAPVGSPSGGAHGARARGRLTR